MLSNDELKEYANNILDNELIIIESVNQVNHDPHPYTIGHKHLERNYNIYLDTQKIDEMEEKYGGMCAHPKCKLKYHDHKSDKVAFIRLIKDITGDEITNQLLLIKSKYEEEKVSGFAIVNTGSKVLT